MISVQLLGITQHGPLTRGSIEFSREGNIPEPWLRRIDGDDDLSDIDTDITNDNEVTA